jgi:preprotein translocase subunit SecE
MTKSTVTPKPENRIVRYLKDTRAEIAKVTWPTREEGLRLSGIVFLVTIVSTIVLFGVDSLFAAVIGLLISGTAG